MPPGFIISRVKKGSPADKAGIRAGDFLFKINDSFFNDVIDFYYLCSDSRLTLSVYTQRGHYLKVKVKKKYVEELGLEFLSPAIGPVRRCQNCCLFCFIDQQPGGLRPSLYEKDDDYRLSFFYGNYITLTNMGELDIKRIVRRGISPLYVSIHSTIPAVRRKLMGNAAAGNILEQLRKLVGEGIEIHGQVVVCPGINNGQTLEKTVDDLAALYPGLKTVALVPVGLTGYRNQLFPLRGVLPAEAGHIVEYYSKIQERFQKQLGTPFIYLADEFYLLCKKPLPLHEHYGAYQQIENGVGLGRMFLNEVAEWKKLVLPSLFREKAISLVTGYSGKVFLEVFREELEKIKGLKTDLYVLPNLFWGGNVTVSGLLTGSDLLQGLKGKNLGEVVFIPSVMLKEGTSLFLDNISLGFLANRLKTPVVPVSSLMDIRKYILQDKVPVIC